MPGIFSASEVLKVALEIERNGEVFYSAMAERLGDERVKELFKYLAGEERRHAQYFRKMEESVGEYRPRGESYPGEWEAYVKALAGSRIFSREMKPEELAERVKTEVEALEMAIGAEKESILFYTEMKQFVPESEHGVIEKIIDQEREHLVKLSSLKASL